MVTFKAKYVTIHERSKGRSDIYKSQQRRIQQDLLFLTVRWACGRLPLKI